MFSQTIEQAKSYFKRKVKFVTEQMEKVQMLGIEKSQVRDGKYPTCKLQHFIVYYYIFSFKSTAVAEVMELKVQAQVNANQQPSVARA